MTKDVLLFVAGMITGGVVVFVFVAWLIGDAMRRNGALRRRRNGGKLG